MSPSKPSDRLKKTKASVDEPIVSRFDYAILSDPARSVVEQKTGEIRERLKRSAQDIWEIGERLCEVRTALKHGQFDIWLKAEFGWSRRTAYNFINVYESFGNRANLAQVDIATSALYLLAAPSTPNEVRQSVIAQAKGGGKVAHKEIADRLKQGHSHSHDKSVDPQDVTIDVAVSSMVTELPLAPIGSRQEIVRILSHPQSLKVDLKLNQWYVLGDRHHLFTGDTRLPRFSDQLPEIRLAIAITGDEWDHDWLVDMADSLIVLQPEMVQSGTIEQLILMFTKPNDVVVFPWLPQPEMIAVADRLGRTVYAGDADVSLCQMTVQAVGLTPKLT